MLSNQSTHQMILLVGTFYTDSLLHFSSGNRQVNPRPSSPVDIEHMWPYINSCFGDHRTKTWFVWTLNKRREVCSLRGEKENYIHKARCKTRFRITRRVDEEQQIVLFIGNRCVWTGFKYTWGQRKILGNCETDNTSKLSTVLRTHKFFKKILRLRLS
jgi:hypothetical protein